MGSEAKPMVWGHSGSGGQTLPTKGRGCRAARIPSDLFGKERGHTHRLSRHAHGCDEDAGSSCQQRGTIGAFQQREIFLPSRETKLSEVEAADRRFSRRYFYSNRAKFRNPLSKQHGSYSKPSSKAICCYCLPAALQTCRGGEYLQFFTSPGAWCLHVQLPGFVAGPHPSFILAHVQPLSRTAGAKGSRWKLPTPATSQ